MHRRSVNDSGDRHGDGTRQYPLGQQFRGQHMITLLDCLGSNRSLPQFPVPFRFRGEGGEGCEMTPSPQPPRQNSENFASSTGPIRERVCCGHDGTPRSGQASKVSPTLWVPQCSAGLSTRIFGVPLDLQGYNFQKAQMGPVFPNSLGAQRIPNPSAESPRAAPFFPDDANICPLIACHSLSRMSLPQSSQGTLWVLLFSFFLLRLHQVPLWRNWFSYL